MPAGLTNETVLDTWTYDPTNGLGEVASIVRRRGTSTPSSNPVVWQESYGYDTAARPTSTATTITEASAVALNSALAYDSITGHLATQTYPSGLTVQHSYTAYGQIDALFNPANNAVFWVAQATNEWGHVTKEQYPGVITGTHSDFDATGQSNTLSWSGSVSDQFAYDPTL